MEASSGSQLNHDDDRARSLLALAYHYARRVPLTHEDAEDCALFVLERMYARFGLDLAPPNNVGCPDAWLHRCVQNLVLRYLRRLRSERRHLTPPAADDPDDPAELIDDIVAADRSPEEQAIQKETWREIIAAIDRLTLTQHLDFLQCDMCGETPEEIARITGRTRAAVYHSLERARRRMRALLEEQGFTEAELRRVFTPPPGDLAGPPPV
jgi:RNA polymerase sigma factor (sigma-70 family)